MAVLQRIENYFKERNLDPKHAPWMYVRYFFIFGTIIFGWAWTLTTDSFLLQLALCFPIGFACALVCAC
jgi:hypothetical protein